MTLRYPPRALAHVAAALSLFALGACGGGGVERPLPTPAQAPVAAAAQPGGVDVASRAAPPARFEDLTLHGTMLREPPAQATALIAVGAAAPVSVKVGERLAQGLVLEHIGPDSVSIRDGFDLHTVRVLVVSGRAGQSPSRHAERAVKPLRPAAQDEANFERSIAASKLLLQGH